MTDNSQKQNGSALVAIVVIIVVLLLAALGFVFYQNVMNKDSAIQAPPADTQSVEDDSNSTIETPAYTFDNAVTDISKTLGEKGCGGSGVSSAITKDMFKEVDDSSQFVYEAGMSKINSSLSYAFAQYGCGSQGSIALLKRVSSEWALVSEGARVYPMCNSVRGQGFPASIIDKCYADDRAAEPVAL